MAGHITPMRSVLILPWPYYKQVHFMVVIFVVNYVFLYFTLTVNNEYR